MQSYSWRSWTRSAPQPRDRTWKRFSAKRTVLLSRVDVIIDFEQQTPRWAIRNGAQ